MKHNVGLDVSLKEVSIRVVEADGAVIAEGKVATEPALIVSWIGERIGAVERIVHESGPLSIWLTRALASRGAPVVCIDARAAHKVLSARMNKSDRADAEGLAPLARTVAPPARRARHWWPRSSSSRGCRSRRSRARV